MMTKERWFYLCACLTCVVVIGLGPSIGLNILPSLIHSQWMMAFMQATFVFGSALILYVLFEVRWYYAFLLVPTWLLIMSGCIWAGVESAAMSRGDISAGREEKIHLIGAWDTQLEEWKGKKSTLMEQYQPVEGEHEYKPTGKARLEVTTKGRDEAKVTRDVACKYSTASPDCKNATAKLETAQERLDRITQNYELTQRIDDLDAQIAELQKQALKVGAPPPDHLMQAAKVLSRFTSIDAQTLAEDRSLHMAVIADVWAGVSPIPILAAINLLFLFLFGEDWWRTPPLSVRESPQVESPQQMAPTTVTPIARKPRETPQDKEWGAAFIPGIKAWVSVALPSEDAPAERYSPKQALDHYHGFCKREGYPPASLQAFGRILKNSCGLYPHVKMGGVGYYRFNLSPSKVIPLKRETA
jgi:hypothetical protein